MQCAFQGSMGWSQFNGSPHSHFPFQEHSGVKKKKKEIGLNSTGSPDVDRPTTPLSSFVFILWGVPVPDLISNEKTLWGCFYRGVSFVISLFIGGLLVFIDARSEINEPMIFGLKKPMCKMTCHIWCVWFTGWTAVDSCTDSGLKDSSVVEEQRDFQLWSTNAELSLMVLLYVFIEAYKQWSLFNCARRNHCKAVCVSIKPTVLNAILKEMVNVDKDFAFNQFYCSNVDVMSSVYYAVLCHNFLPFKIRAVHSEDFKKWCVRKQ